MERFSGGSRSGHTESTGIMVFLGDLTTLHVGGALYLLLGEKSCALKPLGCPRTLALHCKGEEGGEGAMNVDHEVNLLVEEIHRLGSKNADGKLSVKFGVLFRDDKCANLFEALVGTLKAAKRRKIVTYSGELLLQGVHDHVDIVLLQD
ncbi:costars family protein ABRACL isoform X1 [Castor canadensis]|uniref:Costars family protein ABRACL isoform X1 n=2 Tax=Castor canadensis TaxID=51338 RepID=A0AC58MJ94_CASCN